MRGGGPQAVVTDLGILEPDESGELVLTALHPGATIEQAKANTGWDLTGCAIHLRNRPSCGARAAHSAAKSSIPRAFTSKVLLSPRLLVTPKERR